MASVAQAGRLRRLRAGAYLFRQGERATNLYILVAGQVKMTQITPEGHQVLLRVAGPGETLGVIASVDSARYPATAQAADDCWLLRWDNESILSLMLRFPQLAINALRIVSGRVQEFQDRYRELATERVERRIARALLLSWLPGLLIMPADHQMTAVASTAIESLQGLPLWSEDQPVYDQSLATVRESLSDEDFGAELDKGRVLSWEEARRVAVRKQAA